MNCRICSTPLPAPFLDLGVQTFANNLVAADDPVAEPRLPLALARCVGCAHVQLTVDADPAALFSTYYYTPSQSQTFHRHFAKLAAEINELFVGRERGIALDIGSNDGLLLGYMRERGFTPLGVDPALNLAVDACLRQIPTLAEFWNVDLARLIGRKVSVVTATNVFAHNPDPVGFARAVERVLRLDGVFVVECPSLLTMLRDGTFDLTYHEHYNYFSASAATDALRHAELEVFRVDDVPIHGGSLRIFAGHTGAHPVDPALIDRLARETAVLNSETAFVDFTRRAGRIRDDLISVVAGYRRRGERLVGYGAPAKAAVLVNYCGFSREDVEYIVDDNPLKQGKCLPGSRIPVVSSSRLREAPPRAIIVFPWNVAQDILPKLPKGVDAIIPMPKLRVEKT